MTIDMDAWQARNDEYLGAALADLRHRLEAAARATRSLAAPPSAAAPAAPDPRAAKLTERTACFFRRAPPEAAAAAGTAPRLASAPAPMIDTRADTARRLAAASEGNPPPALLMLARKLGLSDFERDILLLCVAMELDTGAPALCAAAQGQADRDHPTFALAMALFDAPAWDAVSPERPLRHWRLIEISQPAARPLMASALRADERIVNYVKGLNYLDDRLAPLVQAVPMPALELLPPSQRAAVAAVSHALQAGGGRPRPGAVVVLRGIDRASKLEVAGAAAAALGMVLYRLPADGLPGHGGDLETLARLWHRESLLLPLALHLDAHELDRSSGPESLQQRLARFLSRSGGLVFVDTREGIDVAQRPAIALDIARPTVDEQQAAWAAAIGARAPQLPALLSAQFDLSRSSIEELTRSATTDAALDGDVLEKTLWESCRRHTRPSLDRLAQRLDARATWKQLVLPAHETALLEQIAAQVRSRARVYDEWGFRARMNRGLGVSALFAGASGTGKTMAAEVLANALKLDLFRIDLSAVVSKYIGETEKNLREVFDAAEGGGAILLFDEADALFGKRSEVKDSHDRYANIEIDYLLQRMEAFSGLAILATNMKSALDAAFMRRLRFIVNFPYPGPAERRRIWERVFPPDTPLGAIDYDRLARLNLTGGNIQSVALASAFMAAQFEGQKRRVTMPLLLQAGRLELRKLERPVNEADFRWVEAAEELR